MDRPAEETESGNGLDDGQPHSDDRRIRVRLRGHEPVDGFRRDESSEKAHHRPGPLPVVGCGSGGLNGHGCRKGLWRRRWNSRSSCGGTLANGRTPAHRRTFPLGPSSDRFAGAHSVLRNSLIESARRISPGMMTPTASRYVAIEASVCVPGVESQ